MNSNIQSAISAAKQRMKSGYWQKRANGAEVNVQNDEKIEDMYSVVKSIMESSEIVTNPIDRIMDKAYYNSLDEVQKSAYILQLSRTYFMLKQKYYDSLSQSHSKTV